MTSKKRKDIAQEVKSLETKGLDANQKAIELAKLAEKTQQTFNSLDSGLTTELIQELNQLELETQQSVNAQHGLEIGKIKEVSDGLEQKQEDFVKAINSNLSDVNQLINLKNIPESLGIDNYHIANAEQAKKEENEFLSKLNQGIDSTQDQLRRQLDESKKRRQSAQSTYRSKELSSDDKKNQPTSLDSTSNNIIDVITDNSPDKNPLGQKIYLAGVDVEKLTEQFNDIKDSLYSFFGKTAALATVGTSLFMTLISNPKLNTFIYKATQFSISAIEEIVDKSMDVGDVLEVNNRTAGAYYSSLPDRSILKQVSELSERQSDFLHLSDEAQDLAEIENEKKRKAIEMINERIKNPDLS